MGHKFGGRQAGTKNKATIERENLLSRAIGELNRPLGKDVLAEVMVEFRDMAKEQTGPIDRGASRLFDTIPRGPSHRRGGTSLHHWHRPCARSGEGRCPPSAEGSPVPCASPPRARGGGPLQARRRRTGTRPALLGGPAQRGVSRDLSSALGTAGFSRPRGRPRTTAPVHPGKDLKRVEILSWQGTLETDKANYRPPALASRAGGPPWTDARDRRFRSACREPMSSSLSRPHVFVTGPYDINPPCSAVLRKE